MRGATAVGASGSRAGGGRAGPTAPRDAGAAGAAGAARSEWARGPRAEEPGSARRDPGPGACPVSFPTLPPRSFVQGRRSAESQLNGRAPTEPGRSLGPVRGVGAVSA